MLILNERIYAEKCINEGIVDKNPYQVISILARYYYHHCGFKKKETTKLLMDYLEKHYPRYELNETQWLSAVEKIVANAKNQTLYELSGVKITKGEISIIKSIRNKSLEKLLFTMLCLAKFHNLKNPKNNGWVNTKTEEIFKLSRVSCTAVSQDIKLNELYLLGLIEFPKQNDNLNCRVTFCEDGDEALFVSDFRELGYEYLNYLGEKFIRCGDCGVLTRPGKTNRKNYCNQHGSNKRLKTEKVVYCIECGKPIEISMKNNKSSRCDTCYEVYRRNYYRENKRKQREIKKMSTVQN